MNTISVGQTVEIVAAHAADYAASGRPDLDERVEALANDLAPMIEGPTVNTPRFFEALFERLEAAIDAMAEPGERRLAQMGPTEIDGQRLFVAAMAGAFRRRLEHGAQGA